MITRTETTITIIYDKEEGSQAATVTAIHKTNGFRIAESGIPIAGKKGFYVMKRKKTL